MEGLFKTIGAGSVAVRQFTPSKYQVDIFDFIDHGEGHGFVEAVAGSGKTTTLKKAAKRLSDRPGFRYGSFLAFNSHIAAELKNELPRGWRASTISAVGHRCVLNVLKDVKVDQFKYERITRGYINAQLVDALSPTDRTTLADEVVIMIRYVHAMLADPNKRDQLDAIIEHFGLDMKPELSEWVYQIVPVVIYAGEQEARGQRVISFSDQLWLPHRWNLKPFQNDVVFVDEAQDLTAAQLDMAMKCVKPGGRMIFVGDRRQAIYGFTGADAKSIDNIIKRTNAKVFPLSICYRCPKSHIRLAKTLVPAIEWADDAPEGILKEISLAEMEGMVKEGDLVLCRTTAPLIEQCFNFIMAGIPARVRGREIGTDLVSALHKVAQTKTVDEAGEIVEQFDLANFEHHLKKFENAHINVFKNMIDGDAKLAAVLDKTQCLRIIYQTRKPKDIEEFDHAILSLFSNDTVGVTLCTIHRAKGLETDRSFILRRDLMPHPNASADWEIEQEKNLEYVCYTRAKREMYFVK